MRADVRERLALAFEIVHSHKVDRRKHRLFFHPRRHRRAAQYIHRCFDAIDRQAGAVGLQHFTAMQNPVPLHGLFRLEFVVDHNQRRPQEQDMPAEALHVAARDMVADQQICAAEDFVLAVMRLGVISLRSVAAGIADLFAVQEAGNPTVGLRAEGLALAVDQHAVVSAGMTVAGRAVRTRAMPMAIRHKQVIALINHIDRVVTGQVVSECAVRARPQSDMQIVFRVQQVAVHIRHPDIRKQMRLQQVFRRLGSAGVLQRQPHHSAGPCEVRPFAACQRRSLIRQPAGNRQIQIGI